MRSSRPDDGADREQDRPVYRIDTADRGAGTVVTVGGELDYTSVPALRVAIDAALRDLDGRFLVLDLADVTFLGSAGISALVETLHAAVGATDARRPLRVVVDHARAVTRPLQIAGVDELLALHETVDAALRA